MRTEVGSPALGWLLAALVFSLCLGAEGQLTSVGGLPIRPYLPLLLVAGAAIALRVVRRGYFPTVPAKGSILPLGILLLAGILSIFNAEYAAEAIKQTVFLTGMIGIYLVLLLAELQPRDLRRITLAIVWSLTVAVAYGVIQFASEYSQSGSVVVAFVQFHSFFEERNEFGLFMIYASGFLIPLALNDRASIRYKLLLVSTLVVLLLNFSRGSLLAFAGMIVLDRLGAGRLFASRPIRRSLLALSGLGLTTVAGALVLVPALAGLTEFLDVLTARAFGFGATTDETTSVRLLFIQTAGRAFLNHPLIGNGIGNVGYVLNQFGRAADYGTVTFRGAVQPPVYDLGTTSNLFVDLLLETGLVGLVAFLAVLIAVFRSALVRGRAQGWIGLMHTGALLSLFGVLINGLSYNSLYLPFTWVAFALAPLTAAWQGSPAPVPAPRAAPPASVT
jgi:O-antigen ligase